RRESDADHRRTEPSQHLRAIVEKPRGVLAVRSILLGHAEQSLLGRGATRLLDVGADRRVLEERLLAPLHDLAFGARDPEEVAVVLRERAGGRALREAVDG